MDVVRFSDAPTYTAPDHGEIVARRLQGGEASPADFVLVGHSTFPEKARIPMGAASFGRVYVVTQGALTLTRHDDVRHVLAPGDSVYVPAGEERAVANEGDGPAAMIVVTPPPGRAGP